MRRVARLIAVLCVVGPCTAASGYAATATAPTETYAQLLKQIDSRSVTTAILNRVAHDVKVTLRDSSTARTVYPPHDERPLVRRLKAHGAQVKYTRRKKAATHHILRYIGGAIVVVIIAAGGGMFLYTRRRPSSGGGTAA